MTTSPTPSAETVTLRERGLNLLRSCSKHGQALENHCLRLARFTMALADKEGIAVDEDLTYAACYLHDIGLCVEDPTEKNYLKRGHQFALERTADWGLTEPQKKFLADVMLYSHSLAAVPHISAQGDLVRRAVSVEHSLGKMRHGLDAATCRAVFREFPRRGFNRVLLSFFRIAILDDGIKELVRVFFPSHNATV